jgi:hypothetical protein
MAKQKTYLHPLLLRRGQPVVHYVLKEPSHKPGVEWEYMLGTMHMSKFQVDRLKGLTLEEMKKKYTGPASGTRKDYLGSSEMTISKELYDALLRESKANHIKYVR